MVSFQASLLNSGTGLPDLTVDCINSLINGNDDSNYTTNTDAGHAITNFTLYRKVYFSLPNGFTFIFSSLGDGNATITAASSTTQNFAYTITQGDGVYTVALLTIPTFHSAITYLLNDLVYLNGLIYLSLIAGNTTTPSGGTDANWAVQTEVQAQANTKYYDIQQVGDSCDMYTCRDSFTAEAFCAVNGDCDNCGDCDLCKNDNLLNSVQLDVLIDTFEIAENNRDFGLMQCVMDKANTLCCTDNPNCQNC